MSESKFTKGPWRWEVNIKHKRVVLTGGKPRYDKDVLRFERYGMQGAQPTFCEIGDRDIQGEKASDLSCVIEGREHHESWFRGLNHPDAHLIAAAPEMYEALQATSNELQWALSELNKRIERDHDYSSASLDPPELLDMETCHNNAVLLAKARGE